MTRHPGKIYIALLLGLEVSCILILPGSSRRTRALAADTQQTKAPTNEAQKTAAQDTAGEFTITSAVLTPKPPDASLIPSGPATLAITGTNLRSGDTEVVIGSEKPTALSTTDGKTSSVEITLPTDYRQGMQAYLVSASNQNLASPKIATTAASGAASAPAPKALFTVHPLILSFPDTLIGSTSTVRSVTITSQAAAALKVNLSAPAADFTIAPALPYQCELPPSSSCTIAVSFAPKHPDSTDVNILLTADGSLPAQVTLVAKGIACCPSEYKDSSHFWWGFGGVLLVVFLYLVGMLTVRWNLVALPTRRLLLAHLDSLENRSRLWLPEGSIVATNIKSLLENARLLNTRKSVADFLLWTRGQELSGWGYAHEAEAELAAALPVEVVRVQLESAEAQLRTMSSPCAELADRIKAALDATSIQADLCRSLLREILTYFASSTMNLEPDLKSALDPQSTFTVPDYQDLARRLIAFLNPPGLPLSDRMKQALSAAPPLSNDQLIALLTDAVEALTPQAAALSGQLDSALKDANFSQGQWKQLLQQVQQYITPQLDIAMRIREALAIPIDRWRSLLAEAISFVSDRTDTDFASLISWQNKTLWMVGCGLLLVLALAGVVEHAVLFLLGATGGLLSRLSRNLQRADVPTDYGASWTTLFLSPVAGALAGWAGVLLIILGVQLEVLGQMFGKVDWCSPCAPAALGVAFLLGFSERAFDGILDQLQDKVQGSQSTTTTPMQAQSLKITSPATLSAGKVDQPYNQNLVATGGKPPYKWTLMANKLPDGLQLDPIGTITGKPKTSGTFKFTLQVADAASSLQSQEFSINIT